LVFNAEHMCNANGGAISKLSNQPKTIKYISHQELQIHDAVNNMWIHDHQNRPNST